MQKSLVDISWKIDEAGYRKDPALSYSTLARFEREGFHKIESLFDKIETSSLTFGSMVDTLITGSKEEFDELFFVADFPVIPDTEIDIIKDIYDNSPRDVKYLKDVSPTIIIDSCNKLSFRNNWKDQTRIDKIVQDGGDYFEILSIAENKKVVSSEEYTKAVLCKRAVENSPTTKNYFVADPFDTDNIERLFQLKFRSDTLLPGIPLRCMVDLINVDHNKKTIQPLDLKTSSHYEDEFYKSFIQWRYDIQGRLYWRLIKEAAAKDEYFKDFKVLPYKFVVVNKDNLTPLVWDFKHTEAVGDLKFVSTSTDYTICLREPFVIARELNYYLNSKSSTQLGIKTGLNESNSLEKWITK